MAKNTIILTVILGLLLLSLGFTLGLGSDYFELVNESSQEEPVVKIPVEDYVQCEGLELSDAAYCMRDYIEGIYNYKLRPDYEKSIDDLIQNGGDCYDYNTLYERMGSELGFSSYSFRIQTENKAHRIAVIMNDSGYCKLDMLHEPDCFIFN